MKRRDWRGLYGESWTGEIVPDAFAHPAKFSRALIRQIYQFLFDEGLVHEGDVVVDPFGGVALGALDAMLLGLNWEGVELEQKFVDLGNRNIELWNTRYAGKFARWGTARLIQGDSRELSKVIGEAGVVVSSPPYADQETGDVGNYASIGAQKDHRSDLFSGDRHVGYTRNPANLGNLKARNFDAVIASPPFAEQQSGGGLADAVKHYGQEGATVGRINQGYKNQGTTPGQLGAMKPGDVSAVISSPPYEGSANEKQHTDSGIVGRDKRRGKGMVHNFRYTAAIVSSPPYEASISSGHDGIDWAKAGRPDRMGPSEKRHYPVGEHGELNYGPGQENLGNSRGEDFWSAAQIIVAECYKLLKPNGVAVWVCKDFVRNKERVPFSEQWAKLCKSLGFKQTHWIRAWVVEDKGTQIDLSGNHHNKRVERKSFFRRLAEQKGSPRIDWEDVLVFVK